MTDASSWSPQQVTALGMVEDWFSTPNTPQVFKLFGYAGTGKTTLAIEIAERVRAIVKDRKGGHPVLFAAFTGKAALVMRRKGCAGASTLHGLIYRVDEDSAGGTPKFVLKEDSALADAALLIIDECSMVGAELATDVLSFGKKVLVLGDPAQLPPVDDAGYFTNGEPDVMLTEVHRQAQGNPIIRLSMDVREGRRLEPGDYGAARIIRHRETDRGIVRALILEADQVLVGRNDTRTAYNARIRDLLGFRGDPKKGERLVCLRNDHTKGILNGGLFRVEKVRKANAAMMRLIIKSDDSESERKIEVKVHPYFFNGGDAEPPWQDLKRTQRLTYGYALTVHKSQGSQWPNVVLFDESGVFRDDARRWLYTGITRAAERLTVVM